MEEMNNVIETVRVVKDKSNRKGLMMTIGGGILIGAVLLYKKVIKTQKSDVTPIDEVQEVETEEVA